MTDQEEGTIVVLDGLEDALLGIADGVDGSMAAIYSTRKIIEHLESVDGGCMSREGAIEYYYHNIRIYAGKNNPMFMDDLDRMEEE